MGPLRRGTTSDFFAPTIEEEPEAKRLRGGDDGDDHSLESERLVCSMGGASAWSAAWNPFTKPRRIKT